MRKNIVEWVVVAGISFIAISLLVLVVSQPQHTVRADSPPIHAKIIDKNFGGGAATVSMGYGFLTLEANHHRYYVELSMGDNGVAALVMPGDYVTIFTTGSCVNSITYGATTQGGYC